MGFGLSWKSVDNWSKDYLDNHFKEQSQFWGGTLDPSNSRLKTAGLLQGGGKGKEKQSSSRVDFGMTAPNGQVVPVEKDWRLRVSVAKESNLFYNSENGGILEPLRSTMGVIFPYTPTVTFNYSASYASVKPTHSNYPSFFYENSDIQSISISGDFTVQTREEGQYLLACIYFFRASTKMFFGNNEKYQGNPPPILFLDGYGTHIIPHVPCVLTSFQHTMNNEVDYIEIPSIVGDPSLAFSNEAPFSGELQPKGPFNRLPTNSQIQINLQPIYSRNKVTKFNLAAFARGDLINKGYL